jgi:hypothetical protein
MIDEDRLREAGIKLNQEDEDPDFLPAPVMCIALIFPCPNLKN